MPRKYFKKAPKIKRLVWDSSGKRTEYVQLNWNRSNNNIDPIATLSNNQFRGIEPRTAEEGGGETAGAASAGTYIQGHCSYIITWYIRLFVFLNF